MTAFPPIVRSVLVKAGPEAAFRRFTSEMDRWWPLRTHSVGLERSVGVGFEPRVGGRILERAADGTEWCWGEVTEWDPPRRVAFTWHPGEDPATAQDIEVRFTPEGAQTRVTLIHQGFERLGDKAAKAHRGYPIGWTYVLGLYAQRRDLGMAALAGATKLLMWMLQRGERRAARRAGR